MSASVNNFKSKLCCCFLACRTDLVATLPIVRVVYFSTLGPASYDLGTADYEENIIVDCQYFYFLFPR